MSDSPRAVRGSRHLVVGRHIEIVGLMVNGVPPVGRLMTMPDRVLTEMDVDGRFAW